MKKLFCKVKLKNARDFIRTENAEALKKLVAFLKLFDFQIVEKKTLESAKLPIEWATEPDVLALAGVWKDKHITQDELRAKAWGDRL